MSVHKSSAGDVSVLFSCPFQWSVLVNIGEGYYIWATRVIMRMKNLE